MNMNNSSGKGPRTEGKVSQSRTSAPTKTRGQTDSELIGMTRDELEQLQLADDRPPQRGADDAGQLGASTQQFEKHESKGNSSGEGPKNSNRKIYEPTEPGFYEEDIKRTINTARVQTLLLKYSYKDVDDFLTGIDTTKNTNPVRLAEVEELYNLSTELGIEISKNRGGKPVEKPKTTWIPKLLPETPQEERRSQKPPPYNNPNKKSLGGKGKKFAHHNLMTTTQRAVNEESNSQSSSFYSNDSTESSFDSGDSNQRQNHQNKNNRNKDQNQIIINNNFEGPKPSLPIVKETRDDAGPDFEIPDIIKVYEASPILTRIFDVSVDVLTFGAAMASAVITYNSMMQLDPFQLLSSGNLIQLLKVASSWITTALPRFIYKMYRTMYKFPTVCVELVSSAVVRTEHEAPYYDPMFVDEIQSTKRHENSKVTKEIATRNLRYKYRAEYSINDCPLIYILITGASQLLGMVRFESLGRFFDRPNLASGKVETISTELLQSALTPQNLNGHVPLETTLERITRTINNRSDSKLSMGEGINQNIIESTTNVSKFLAIQSHQRVNELGFQISGDQLHINTVIGSSIWTPENDQPDPIPQNMTFTSKLLHVLKQGWRNPLQSGGAWGVMYKVLLCRTPTLATLWAQLLAKSSEVQLTFLSMILAVPGYVMTYLGRLDSWATFCLPEEIVNLANRVILHNQLSMDSIKHVGELTQILDHVLIMQFVADHNAYIKWTQYQIPVSILILRSLIIALIALITIWVLIGLGYLAREIWRKFSTTIYQSIEWTVGWMKQIYLWISSCL